MKSIYNLYTESILDDIDTSIERGDIDIMKDVLLFINENYIGDYKISRKPNKDGLYEVSSLKDIDVKQDSSLTTLTNGMFIWTTVKGNFSCYGCRNLVSLEGAPKEVGDCFDCSYCVSLESLKGAPKKVGDCFFCYKCTNLKSLEGAPKEVKGDFKCNDCSSLESLKGAPKEVGGNFKCHRCKIKFTKEDVTKVCNVNGKIYIY